MSLPLNIVYKLSQIKYLHASSKGSSKIKLNFQQHLDKLILLSRCIFENIKRYIRVAENSTSLIFRIMLGITRINSGTKHYKQSKLQKALKLPEQLENMLTVGASQMFLRTSSLFRFLSSA